MKTKVWLGSSKVGDPPKRQFFSLVYKNEDDEDVHTDLSGFRPDPRDYLKEDKKYDAIIFLDDPDFDVKELRKIIVEGRTFIMIR